MASGETKAEERPLVTAGHSGPPPSTAPGHFSRTRTCARRGKRHPGVVESRPPSAPPRSLSGHVFVPAPGPDWLSGFSHLGSFIHSANKHLVTVYTRRTALWALGHHSQSVRLSFPGAAKAAGMGGGGGHKYRECQGPHVQRGGRMQGQLSQPGDGAPFWPRAPDTEPSDWGSGDRTSDGSGEGLSPNTGVIHRRKDGSFT